jgi:hypothetical protein
MTEQVGQWRWKEISLESIMFLFDEESNLPREHVKDLTRFNLLMKELIILVEEIVQEHGTEAQKEVWFLMKCKKKQWEIGVILSPEKPLAQFTVAERIMWLQRKIQKYIAKSAKGQRILRELRSLVQSSLLDEV